VTQDLVERPAHDAADLTPGAPPAERGDRRAREASQPGLREVAVAAGLIGLSGFLFWVLVGGSIALLGGSWIAP
jgi:hypothetical protein